MCRRVATANDEKPRSMWKWAAMILTCIVVGFGTALMLFTFVGAEDGEARRTTIPGETPNLVVPEPETTGAQGHNSLPPEHVSRRLQFVDSGAEPLEFDAATLRLPTSSLQVTTPPNVDFATECCRRGINDGPGYYPDDLNCRPNVLLIHLV
ncbi:hypothetical protein HPB51_018364 [Rhipicephalus microplus]|uniref:Uncharacterized protein n=1 Tax=Rhipicephalus microplus TaxID=6941 RepID=A0A9J6EUI0_RHIMP|nr:hypothetical protein HPB51_018364 [Rhipicephalus microplus]